MPCYWKLVIQDNGIWNTRNNIRRRYLLSFSGFINKNEYCGTGIGCAIVKKIIK